MTGVLHPVGPEPAATYWLRRVLVLGVLALVAVVVAAFSTGESRQQSAVPTAASAPSMGDATPTSRVPVAGTGGSASVTASASTSATAKPRSATSTAARVKAAQAKPAGAKPASSTARASQASPPPSCAPRRLRTTLTGHELLKVQQPTVFDLSVINGSAKSCVVKVTGDNFEVTIHSGRDRIWSTSDCSRAVGSHKQQRASQKAMAWQLKWNGRRSAPGCKSRSETLRPGTYVATARLNGADLVRLRMVLHG